VGFMVCDLLWQSHETSILSFMNPKSTPKISFLGQSISYTAN
jgi:hypothetical protein